jgi:hypothetical protein
MAATGTVKRAGIIGKNRGTDPSVKPGKPKTFDYSRYRQTINNTDHFAQYVAGYPDPTGLCAYIYRLSPRVDSSLIGSPVTNIHETVTASEMTPEFVEKKFGRGRYMLKLNDANRVKGQNEVATTFFKLDDSLLPPVYDIRTLVLNHADNMDEVNRQIALGVLTRDQGGNPRIRTNTDGPPLNGNGHAPAPVTSNGASDLFSRETMASVLLKMIDKAQTNPADAVKQSIEIARMLQPAAAPAVDLEAMVDRIVARLAPRNGGGLEMFETYEKVEGILTRLRGPAADAPVTAVDAMGWVAHVPGIIQQVRQAIPELMAGLRALRPATNSSNGTAAAVQNGAAAPMTLEERVEEICKMGFEEMAKGTAGFDFAVFVCSFHPGGREVYDYLDNAGGAAGLSALIAMNPATRALMQDVNKRAQIEAFLTDFFSYDPMGGAASVEPAGAGASPAAG